VSDDLLDRLPVEERGLLLRCGELAAQRGESAYLVGGSVRDLLLERDQADLDVVVEGDGMAVAQALSRAVGGKLTRHHAFRTARVDVSGELHIDIATARSEEYPKPGQLPRVVPGSLHDDLERRDFSINTLAVVLSGDNVGELLDPMGGQAALSEGRISVLHSLSFSDDPTRILRAERFSLRFGYGLGSRTQAWIQEAIAGGYLDEVSGDRVRREVALMFAESPVEGPVRLERDGVLAAVYEGLAIDRKSLEELARNREWYAEVLRGSGAGDVQGAEWTSVLACCAANLAPQARWDLARRLRLSREERRPLIDSGAAWNRSLEAIAAAGQARAARSDIEKAFRDVSADAVLVGAAIAGPDAASARAARLYLEELRWIRPQLGGAELCALGVPEGPEIGEVLDHLLVARLDGDARSGEDEARLVALYLGEEPLQ